MREKSFFKISFLLLIIIFLSINSLGKEEVTLASLWASVPAQIDGLSQDWQDVPLISQKYGVNLGFKNDEKYLYILFVFTDPKYLSSVESTGMSIYFNPEAEKKKESGINFRRISLAADQFIAWMEEKQGPMTEEQKKAYRVHKSYLMFYCGILGKGFKQIMRADESEKILPAAFRIGGQQKTFIYEFAVPLEKATQLASGVGARPGETLTIGFDWGGWSKEIKQAVASRMGDEASKARDQRASDDHTGEGGGGQDARRMQMGDAPEMAAMRKMKPKQYDLWLNLKLAEKQ